MASLNDGDSDDIGPATGPVEPGPRPLGVQPTTGCVALVEVVGRTALRARVPAALARAEVVLDLCCTQLAAMTGGVPRTSSARGRAFTFRTPADAIQFAIQLQVELLGLDWPATLLVRPETAEERGPDGALLFRGLRVRGAIHHGRFQVADDGGIDGPGLYQAARVASVAHGGQVLVTGAAWERVEGTLPTTATVRDLGHHDLAGVDGRIHLLQVLPSTLDGRRFADVDTENVRNSNVPPADEGTVGRQSDLAALSELLGLGVRAVAVVGRPGVGKSRFIRQFAAARAADGRFSGGVWLCRLDEPSLASLVRAVGWALRVSLDERANAPGGVEQLSHALASRGTLLLVIDEIAAPTPEVSAAIDTWLRTAPGTSIIVNARARLRVRGEVEYEVRPLALPSREVPHRGEGVRIYSARARSMDEDFTVDDPALLAELIVAVGGLPLPIRLLAGFVDHLSPEQQLQAITSGDLDPNHLVDSLLDLLDPEEFQVLVACSALPGTFDLRALDAAEIDTLAVVRRLERRGLLRDHPDPVAVGVHRYAVERSVRELVLARLPEDERAGLRERRAAALVRSCLRLLDDVELADRPEIVARIAADWEGVVEAVRIGLDPSREDPEAVELGLRACLLLRPVIQARGPLFVGLELVDGVLRRCDAILGSDPLLQLRALVFRAELLRLAGRRTQAQADLERAASIADRWSDRQSAVLVKIEQAQGMLDVGATEAEVRALEQGLASAPSAGPEGDGVDSGVDPVSLAIADSLIGGLHLAVGSPEAEGRLGRAISTLRRLGVVIHEGRAVRWLALLYRRTGKYDAASGLYRQSVARMRQVGARGLESRAMADLGMVSVHLARYDEAEEGLSDAVHLARWGGDRRAEASALRSLGLLRLNTGSLDAARERFVEALALDRDRGDSVAEGADTGMLGVAFHLADQHEAARESYRRGLALLGEGDESRMVALLSAWAAALEAERLEPVAARAQFDAACIHHAEVGDPQIGEAIAQLRGALDLMESVLAEGQGDVEEAARWRQAAIDRWREAANREGVLPVEARLAHERVGRRLPR